jgi:hypothetical protein
MAGGKSGLTQDSIVKRLISDPGEIPDLVAIPGWLGASTKRNSVRLYLSLSLGLHLEVPEKTIVQSAKIGDGELQGTVLWLPRESKIQLRSSTASVTIKAGYLSSGPSGGASSYDSTDAISATQWPKTRVPVDCWTQPTSRVLINCMMLLEPTY